MGFALAEVANRRGATVKVIAGSTTFAASPGIDTTRVTSAEEMHAAVLDHIKDATIFIATAAVADYRPKHVAQTKIKKSQADFSLELERTPDILAEVARSRRPDQLIVGFAAETDDVLGNARSKLNAKKIDMIVANDVSRADSGFDSENNAVTILIRDNPTPIELPLMRKSEVAERILDEVAKLRYRTAAAQIA
jgi:phosphopantothenoylcysteine decarboxylase/phosphopantothenate--cysteine ligase